MRIKLKRAIFVFLLVQWKEPILLRKNATTLTNHRVKETMYKYKKESLEIKIIIREYHDKSYKETN